MAGGWRGGMEDADAQIGRKQTKEDRKTKMESNHITRADARSRNCEVMETRMHAKVNPPPLLAS